MLFVFISSYVYTDVYMTCTQFYIPPIELWNEEPD